MLTEDDNTNPWPKAGSAAHKNLESMSVAELQEYVAALMAEIKRTEAEIAKKTDSRAAADAVFRK